MNKEQFCDLLSEHNLTVFSFLNMKEDWERLSAEDRYHLVKKEYDEINEKGITYNRRRAIWQLEK